MPATEGFNAPSGGLQSVMQRQKMNLSLAHKAVVIYLFVT